ncbi:hypothetical protein L1987_01400 [Smallanthus sonchifolius]|uniref:Uncharacterized protein n=1 Tax=Smallanthus sonchifolius TaxID=185202 RepID=A0ACB9K4Z6_9ASTR|nr:hypothetical protein L1987_01400 [Smallanthus sonchifolius]
MLVPASGTPTGGEKGAYGTPKWSLGGCKQKTKRVWDAGLCIWDAHYAAYECVWDAKPTSRNPSNRTQCASGTLGGASRTPSGPQMQRMGCSNCFRETSNST